MNPNWQSLGHIASGGTILDISQGSDGTLWTATSSGLLRKQGENWFPVSRGMSFTQLTQILTIRKTIFAAGWPDGILYSTNNGDVWHIAWIDQIESSVNCLAVSPNYAKDRVLLAGTQGKGILRTTDGGRHWQLSNFGLRGFSVYALSSVGVQQTFRDLTYLKEIVFAGTDDGIYYSPNGGRAWLPAGNETSGQTVLAIALSPSFSSDQTLFAGTESGKLFRSNNGGESWELLSLESFSVGAINCLLWAENGDLFVGTSEAGILISSNCGETWDVVLSDVPTVLMLNQIDGNIYAGFHDTGLMFTADFGCTWTTDLKLVAKRFQWFVPSSDKVFVAAGPDEGIWISNDQGITWERSPTWSVTKPVLGISAMKGVILAASPEGIWRSTDSGYTWSLSLENKLNLSPFFITQSDGFAWAAGESGQLWFSKDQGKTWEVLKTDFSGNPVIGIGTSPEFFDDQVLLVGIRDLSRRQNQIWRSTDGGENWSMWHVIKSEDISLHFTILGESGKESIFGSNTQVINREGDTWNQEMITTDDAPITALTSIPGSNTKIVALADQILYRDWNKKWRPLGSAIQGQSIVALHRDTKSDREHTLFALTRDGMIWRCEI